MAILAFRLLQLDCLGHPSGALKTAKAAVFLDLGIVSDIHPLWWVSCVELWQPSRRAPVTWPPQQ